MGVLDGQPVNAATTNPAFLDANNDDTALGKLNFNNISDPTNSGPEIINGQREWNSLSTWTGKPINIGRTVTPPWVNNDLGSSTDSFFTRIDLLTQRFNATAGHKHTGAAGDAPLIPGASLFGVPYAGYMVQGVLLTGITGSSVNVSTQLTGKSPSSNSTTLGIPVTSPYNKTILRDTNGDQFVSGTGDVIYGRVTFLSGVWTLSFYYLNATVETVYSFASATTIDWYYQEIFDPMTSTPVYSQLTITPSDNATADVINATTALYGKVLLSSVAPGVIATTGSAGTGNATIANADHTHEGVHTIYIDGDPTTGRGDVTFQAGSGITLAWVAGKIQIVATGGGSFALQDLSNLTSPTAINQTLLGASGLALNIGTPLNSYFANVNVFTGDVTSGAPTADITFTTGNAGDDAPGSIIFKIGTGSFAGGEIKFQPFSSTPGPGAIWICTSGDGSGAWHDPLSAVQQYFAVAVADTNINVVSPGTNVYDGLTITDPNAFVFLSAQSNPIENGLWNVDSAPPYQLFRGGVFSNGTTLYPGAKVTIASGGTFYGNSLWTINTTNGLLVVGTDPLATVEIGHDIVWRNNFYFQGRNAADTTNLNLFKLLNNDHFTLYDGTNGPTQESIDVTGRQMKDNAANLSVDWSNRNLQDDNGFLAMNWSGGGRQLAGFNGNVVLNFHGSVLNLIDSASIISMDWKNRRFFDSLGNMAIDYSSNGFFVLKSDASGPAVRKFSLNNETDTFAVNLFAPTGLSLNLDFQFPSANGAAGNVLATDGTGVTSWVSVLKDAAGFNSVDFENRRLEDSGGAVSIDYSSTSTVNFNKVITNYSLAADPGTASAGDMYFNTTLNKLKIYNGTTWETVTSI